MPFSRKSVVSSTHEQITCSKTLICRQFFAGHVVGSRPMKKEERMHRIIIYLINFMVDTSRSLSCLSLHLSEQGFAPCKNKQWAISRNTPISD